MAFNAGGVYASFTSNTTQFSQGMSRITSLTNVFVKSFTAVVNVFKDASKASNEFQIEMGNVATLIDTATISTTEMSKELFLLSPELGEITELTKGLYQEFSAGSETAEEALINLEADARFARAGLTDLWKATDVLTSAINAYGRENLTSSEASDIFFRTVEKGKITADELARTMGKVIPTAAQMGIGLEEVGAVIATLTKQGVSAAQATTQFNSIIQSFIKPSEAMTEALLEMGYETGKAFLETEGLTGAVKFLTDAFEQDANSLGELVPRIRGIRGVFGLTGEGAKILEETLLAMNEAAGATDRAFEKQEKTFDTFQASMGKTQILLGNVVNFFVKDVVNSLTLANEAFIRFILSSQGGAFVADILGKITGGFNVLKTTIGLMVDNILKPLGEMWKTIGEGLSDLVSGVGENVTGWDLFAGVLQFSFSAIKIVTGGIDVIIQSLGDVKNVVERVGDVWGAFWDAMAGRASWEQFHFMVRDFGRTFENVVGNFGERFTGIIDLAKEEITSFTENVETNSIKLESAFETSYENTRQIIEDNWDAIVTGQVDAQDLSLSLFGDFNARMQGIIDSTLVDTKNKQTEIVTNTEEILEELNKNIAIQSLLVSGQASTVIEKIYDTAKGERKKFIESMTQSYGDLAKTEDTYRAGGMQAWREMSEDVTIIYEVMGREVLMVNGVIEDSVSDTTKSFVSDWTWANREIERQIIDLEVVFGNLFRKITSEMEQANITWLNVFSNAISEIENLASLSYRTQQNLLDQWMHDEQKALEAQYEQGLINKENYEMELQALEEEKVRKQNEFKKKQFDTEKRFNLGQVGINTFTAIMKAWTAGPVIGAVMTPFLTALGIRQAQLIKQQEFVPSYQEGGRMEQTGPAYVGNEELRVLPGGTIIIPDALSRQIAAGAGKQEIIFNNTFQVGNIDSEERLEALAQRISEIQARQLDQRRIA
jgi:TP901 family phage tail tape measure protein